MSHGTRVSGSQRGGGGWRSGGVALRHTCTSPASSLGYGCRLSQKSAWLPGSHGPTPWLALPRSCQVAGVAVRRAPVWGVAQPANREPWLVACVLRGNPLPSCKQPQIASRKSRHCFVRAPKLSVDVPHFDVHPRRSRRRPLGGVYIHADHHLGVSCWILGTHILLTQA